MMEILPTFPLPAEEKRRLMEEWKMQFCESQRFTPEEFDANYRIEWPEEDRHPTMYYDPKPDKSVIVNL